MAASDKLPPRKRAPAQQKRARSALAADQASRVGQTSQRGADTQAACESHWHIYILRCADGSLYTGITTDIKRRLHEHNHTSRGAGYTRGRRPVTLCFTACDDNRASATRQERRIKRMSREDKERLISGQLELA